MHGCRIMWGPQLSDRQSHRACEHVVQHGSDHAAATQTAARRVALVQQVLPEAERRSVLLVLQLHTALETVNTMSSLGTVDWAGRPRRRTRFRRFASLAIGGSVDIRPWGHPANTHVKRHLGHDAQQCDVPDVDKGRVHRTVR